MITSICPIFPSRDFNRTAEFYQSLGFQKIAEYKDEGYLMIKRDSVELHFFRSGPIDPEQSEHAAFVRVDDGNVLSAEYAKLKLPAVGIPRFTLAQDKPWGLCELAIVDPDGNLLRVGHILSQD